MHWNTGREVGPLLAGGLFWCMGWFSLWYLFRCFGVGLGLGEGLNPAAQAYRSTNCAPAAGVAAVIFGANPG
jgi:hypothetical protein